MKRLALGLLATIASVSSACLATGGNPDDNPPAGENRQILNYYILAVAILAEQPHSGGLWTQALPGVAASIGLAGSIAPSPVPLPA